MPKNRETMTPDTIAAQKEIFEQVLKTGENYLFALARGIFIATQLGTDLPSEVKSDIKTARKQLLDMLQNTMMPEL